jgi:hypothetical protein
LVTPRAAARQSSYSGTKTMLASWCAMQWIEAFINISALAGFIGLANLSHDPTR